LLIARYAGSDELSDAGGSGVEAGGVSGVSDDGVEDEDDPPPVLAFGMLGRLSPLAWKTSHPPYVITAAMSMPR